MPATSWNIAAMPHVTLAEAPDLEAVAARWRALEARADPSFFQRWDWVGCRAAERYPDPVLLAATEDRADVALALFNRHPRRFAPATLFLGESGLPGLDRVFVEHNGPLIARGHAALLPALLRAALDVPVAPRRRRSFGRGLILSGVDATVLDAAPAQVRIANTEPAPFVDLAALRAAGRPYLDALSQNTRYQLRRSARRYAEAGAIRVERAATVEQAWAFLDALAALHQETWTGRGRPGAFADPWFIGFHRDLLAATVPKGAAELLRIAAGAEPVGYLYNFRSGGRVLQYQGGFAYAAAATHQKPGLTCHHLAIEHYLADGADVYDFLAGDDRYKSSLATDRGTLFWLECAPLWSPRGVLNRLRKKG